MSVVDLFFLGVQCQHLISFHFYYCELLLKYYSKTVLLSVEVFFFYLCQRGYIFTHVLFFG